MTESIEVIVGEGKPPIPAGTYKLMYLRSEKFDKGKYGPALKHFFMLKAEEREIQLGYLTPAEPTPYNKFGRMLQALGVTVKAGDTLNMSVYEGNDITALLEHDKNGFLTITKMII